MIESDASVSLLDTGVILQGRLAAFPHLRKVSVLSFRAPRPALRSVELVAFRRKSVELRRSSRYLCAELDALPASLRDTLVCSGDPLLAIALSEAVGRSLFVFYSSTLNVGAVLGFEAGSLISHDIGDGDYPWVTLGSLDPAFEPDIETLFSHYYAEEATVHEMLLLSGGEVVSPLIVEKVA